MTIRFEKVHGQTMTMASPTVNIKYRHTRSWQDPFPAGHAGSYFDWVADNALFLIPRFVDYNPMGRLWLGDIKITEVIYARHYDIEAPYLPPDKAPPGFAGAYSMTVDLIGGTTHTLAGELISVWPPGSPNSGGLIGVDGDEIHGADVVTPEMKLTVSYRHPSAFLNKTYIDALFLLIGHFNADTFLGYAAGQVQYLGGPHTVTEAESTARYTFALSPNATNLVVGGITIGQKYGSDIISPTSEDEVDSGDPVKRVKYIELIRPPSHSWKPFASVFGWGS